MYDQFSFLPRNMSSYLVHLVLRSELNHHSKECNWNERRKLVFNSPSNHWVGQVSRVRVHKRIKSKIGISGLILIIRERRRAKQVVDFLSSELTYWYCIRIHLVVDFPRNTSGRSSTNLGFQCISCTGKRR